MTDLTFLRHFPSDFTFGTATSSYQIEGSSFGGCGESHWDSFARQDGTTFQGEDGRVACDHYHLWPKDLDLIAQAGLSAYRFSLSWPRLLPDQSFAGQRFTGHGGNANPDGIAFYDRLIDGMLERGLTPYATLYHWDLPSRFANKGGWCNRDTTLYFADYTDLVMRHFGDRLTSIATINEPWCVAWLSHYWGAHAPGLTDLGATAKAMHHILLAHGQAMSVMREHGHKNLGIVLNKEFGTPADDSQTALEKTHLFDGIYNRWFEDGVYKGCYPDEVLALFDGHMPDGWQDDMAIISQKTDWTGVNYYTRSVITPDHTEPHIGFRCDRGHLPKTDMGWEVYPEGLSFFLHRLAKDYTHDMPIYITENGMANDDIIRDDVVPDDARIAYLKAHLEQVQDGMANGLPIKGYFAWSLLDNFEWAFGYDKRFGLVHVDYATQKRTPKASYLALQQALLG
ncbi:MAG: GH1 family beta-glucosidase [Candidatus Puniceispirillaceae bacterium]